MVLVFPGAHSSLQCTSLSEALNLITDHFDQERTTPTLTYNLIDRGNEIHG
jgi:hypothetical protein